MDFRPCGCFCGTLFPVASAAGGGNYGEGKDAGWYCVLRVEEGGTWWKVV